MSIPLLIIGIILFISLIVVHEFGHFIMARHSGVEVEEFGIGFPPRAWSKKMKKGYIFSLNWLPIGGFVKMKGENDSDRRPGSLGAASVFNKTKIMLAGIFMNLLVAFLLFTFLGFVGMPQLLPNQYSVARNTKTVRDEVLIQDVEANSPAAAAGIKSLDQLVSFSYGNKVYTVTSSSQLPDITKQLAGKTTYITYRQQGVLISKSTTLRSAAKVEAAEKSGNDIGYLGVSSSDYIIKKSTWAAPINSLGLMGQMIVLTFKALGNVFAGLFQHNFSKAGAQVGGPIAIVFLLKNNSLLGYQFILWFVAYISLSLAIVNVLPLPVLDGGRLYLTVIPRLIRKRPIKKHTEEMLVGVSMVIILMLFVLISAVDLHRYTHIHL
jgi:regulator of sigma E protease